MAILITGATGHLGPHLIAGILRTQAFDRIYVAARHREQRAAARVGTIERIAREELGEARRSGRVIPIEMNAGSRALGMAAHDLRAIQDDVNVIVHAAADTRFERPLDELRVTNVKATRDLCRVAERCPRLTQLLFVSTTCVAGRRSGRVPEQMLDDATGFANGYERTKWEAEHLVASSGAPVRIARLSTCAGSHATGYVHRFGAVHHLLHWMSRGLVPMVPGTAATPVDVISTDIAARWLAHAALHPPQSLEVCHVALGDTAVPLGRLLDFLVSALAEDRRRIERPAIVDETVFRSFNEIVRISSDALMTRVQASAAAMLPALLHPKVAETRAAERCWGGPLPHPDWMELLTQVIAFARRTGWGLRRREPYHA